MLECSGVASGQGLSAEGGFPAARMVAWTVCGLMLACAVVAVGTLLGLGQMSVVMCALPLGLGFPVLLRVRNHVLALLLGALVSALLLWVCWAVGDLSVPPVLGGWLSGLLSVPEAPVAAWPALVTLAWFSAGCLMASVEGSRAERA